MPSDTPSNLTTNIQPHDQPKWLLPMVVASALFMENMDAAVIATSLPAIARDLGYDPVVLKLALTSYLLSLAVFIPVSGWCADRYGARPVFQAAITIFILASVACASAQSLEHLIFARAFQGMGGAMMVPVGRLIVLRSVPKSGMVDALAYLSIPALMAPLIGPPIGGFVTTYFDWRWIFWINVPIGALGLLLAQRYMPSIRAETTRPMDWTGFVLAGPGVAALISGLTLAGSDVIPPELAYTLVVAGFALCALYVRHALATSAPLLDLRLLALPTFRTSIIGGGLFRLGIGAIPFLLPLMLQVGFGLSAFQSGMITFSGAFGALLMKLAARPVLRRFGFRQVLTYNALFCSALLTLYALFTPNTPHLLIALVLVVASFFRSLQFTCLNAVAFSDVSEKSMSGATSLVGVAQQLFLSSGVAMAAFILETSRTVRGSQTLAPADFSTAFLVVAVLTALASLMHYRLPRNAGDTVSGHRPT
ncbi:MAG: MFS transporter [Alphaproteobacteria bacterium]|nr:MFS transporter [Alphaproteobacteria bacterium]